MLVSGIIHLVLLIVLALWTISLQIGRQSVAIESSSDGINDHLEDLQFSAPQTPAISVDMKQPERFRSAALPVKPIAADVKEFKIKRLDDQKSEQQNYAFNEALHLPPGTISGFDLPEGSIIGKPGPQLREVKNEQAAVDGIAAEIFLKRQQGDVLTVWLFDASISLRENRKNAAKRIGEVYKEIEKMLGRKKNGSRDAVAAFGNGSIALMEPTDKPHLIIRAINKMKDDPSGRENVLSAVVRSINHFRKYWKNKIAIVVWTDESGDDLQMLEETISFCKANDVSVSVIGPTAVLGQKMGTHRYRPQKSKSIYYLPVHRGPESAINHRIFMPRWRNVRFNEDQWISDPVSSGLPPYALYRLTKETGGSYTLFDRVGDRGTIRHEDMKEYLPDYRSVDDVETDIAKFPLRRAVVAAVQETYQQPPHKPPRMNFLEFWYPPAEFRARLAPAVAREVVYAQSMAGLADRALAHLTADGVEEAYRQDPSPRWRASYDLARGRLLAMSVRYREYAAVCQTLKLKANTNILNIRTSRTLLVRSNQQHLEESRQYLQRCVNNNPNTPWQLVAENELRSQPGFFASQSNQPAPAQGGGGGGKTVTLPKL